MRRANAAITDPLSIEKLIVSASVCHLALCDGNTPYVVPMNYGYADGVFYLHCAKEGRKLDILRENNNVCIEITIHSQLISADEPCAWSTKYTSIIASGHAYVIETPDEVAEKLDTFMKAYDHKDGHTFNPSSLARTNIIKVIPDNISCKSTM